MIFLRTSKVLVDKMSDGDQGEPAQPGLGLAWSGVRILDNVLVEFLDTQGGNR